MYIFRLFIFVVFIFIPAATAGKITGEEDLQYKIT